MTRAPIRRFESRATEDAQEDRDLARQQAMPKRASESSSPRRCAFCSHWVSPKRERCENCRQRVGTLPLVGLKPVA